MSLTEEEKAAINYRFGGYNLNMIQLDGPSGAGYAFVAGVHPYYRNQPEFWQTAIFFAGQGDIVASTIGANEIFPMIPFYSVPGGVSEES